MTITKLFDERAYNEAADEFREIGRKVGRGLMAERLVVRADGEHIVVVAEGEDGQCEVRLTFAETERFEEALDKVRKRVGLKIEARRAKEAMRVDKVHEDEEDFEESE